MQPLNPFLSAFFKSSLPAQCNPVALHILLVPTTHALLTSRDSEGGGSSLAEAVASEDFLASHVLRIPEPRSGPGGKDAVPNLREMKGKARQYNTINSRSVVIKDNVVYTNKGFKTLASVALLQDALWYPDTLEPRPWLIYYISRPLAGTWEEVKIQPALLVESAPETKTKHQKVSPNKTSKADPGESSGVPRKKEIKTFHDLLNNFPAIARQMHPGLEKLFREFTIVIERPLPPPPSASHIPDPMPEGPITTAMRRARRSSSLSAPRASSRHEAGRGAMENFYAEDDEEAMRASLETAVTSAIDIFQNVDKQQLSLLGATTDLTGPVVERLIERYVTENIHHLLFPRLAALKRPDDLELEAKIRQMEYVDVSQLGIVIEGGSRGKKALILRLGRAVDEFRKIISAMSPQEMLDVLLTTLKTVTQLNEPAAQEGSSDAAPSSEKPVLTINADTLVSFLLFVVIRAQVKHLHARFIYLRHFIFVDDVDSGEMGYALSTFEAVLSYLDSDSAGLRRASRRNKALWDAAAKGDVAELKRVMEPSDDALEEDLEAHRSLRSSRASSSSGAWSFTNGSSRRSSTTLTPSERFSMGSDLSHVFPFHAPFMDGEGDPIEHDSFPPAKKIKRVAMDMRSMSSGSETSFRSRATSIVTLGSGIEGDTSIERLSQTHDSFGESVLMMAVQNGRPDALKYLLSLRGYYPPEVILDDSNNEGTTLLSAAVQMGNNELIQTVLDYLANSPEIDMDQTKKYFARQDIWGRSVAHYLFHAPFLISNYGRLMPWRQKDKNGQTPLFALCRSYDHAFYHSMVEEALEVATEAQGDGEPLHLEDHVDAKGNTLLHIVNDAQLVMRVLQKCDVDVNATNEKRFTPLMVASKYGRYDMVRTFYGDPRVDLAAKELRGLTAVELAKDDDVRNKIDDLTLFSTPPGPDARTTAVVRSYFVEDATIRLVLKSGAPVDKHSYAVTTCRRSLTDFEHLAKLLAMENPASWIPSLAGLRSPFQIPVKPSRAVLKDLQVRLDWFLRILLAHPTFASHEMLWEFFLVPDLQLDMMEQRSRLKAETRAEKVRDELEPLEDVREVEQFVDYARDMVRSVNHSTKSVMRRVNAVGIVTSDIYEASRLLSRAASTLAFLPQAHISALEAYARALAPLQSTPAGVFHASLLALQSTIDAVLAALARPPRLVAQIAASRRQAERSYSSLSRSARWPLGLLDNDARQQRLAGEREEKARQSREEGDNLGRELRHTQQVVAAELAGWQEMHERMGRRAVRELARGMVVAERMRLEGMRRALRKVRELGGGGGSGTGAGGGARWGEGRSRSSRSIAPAPRAAPAASSSASSTAAEPGPPSNGEAAAGSSALQPGAGPEVDVA